jgi:glycine C-acetyltransferase
MKHNIAQILQDELVISKATSHPENTVFEFEKNGDLKLQSGEKIFNTLSNNFLGFNGLNSRTLSGSFYAGKSQTIIKTEKSISRFLQTQDTLIFGSYEGLCADVLESLFNTEDVIIYDSAVSLSMRRGVKVCNAQKLRYPHSDMQTLEQHLKLSMLKRLRVIVSDGIFYDSGECADLKQIRLLAEKYDAIIILDDSYGFLTCGSSGRGSDDLCGVRGFQDLKIVNMQNALGCPVGAFATGNSTITELLRFRCRCYREALMPEEKSLENVYEILENQKEKVFDLIETLHENAKKIALKLQNLGFSPQIPPAGIVSFQSEMPKEEIKSILKENNLAATYSKVGKNTLVSLKVSATWEL